MKKLEFLYPRASYHGQSNPQNLVFNANLQEFSQQINYICGLSTNGKLTQQEAYQKIHLLWRQLKQSKKQLGIN